MDFFGNTEGTGFTQGMDGFGFDDNTFDEQPSFSFNQDWNPNSMANDNQCRSYAPNDASHYSNKGSYDQDYLREQVHQLEHAQGSQRTLQQPQSSHYQPSYDQEEKFTAKQSASRVQGHENPKGTQNYSIEFHSNSLQSSNQTGLQVPWQSPETCSIPGDILSSYQAVYEKQKALMTGQTPEVAISRLGEPAKKDEDLYTPVPNDRSSKVASKFEILTPQANLTNVNSNERKETGPEHPPHEVSTKSWNTSTNLPVANTMLHKDPVVLAANGLQTTIVNTELQRSPATMPTPSSAPLSSGSAGCLDKQSTSNKFSLGVSRPFTIPRLSLDGQSTAVSNISGRLVQPRGQGESHQQARSSNPTSFDLTPPPVLAAGRTPAFPWTAEVSRPVLTIPMSHRFSMPALSLTLPPPSSMQLPPLGKSLKIPSGELLTIPPRLFPGAATGQVTGNPVATLTPSSGFTLPKPNSTLETGLGDGRALPMARGTFIPETKTKLDTPLKEGVFMMPRFQFGINIPEVGGRETLRLQPSTVQPELPRNSAGPAEKEPLLLSNRFQPKSFGPPQTVSSTHIDRPGETSSVSTGGPFSGNEQSSISRKEAPQVASTHLNLVSHEDRRLAACIQQELVDTRRLLCGLEGNLFSNTEQILELNYLHVLLHNQEKTASNMLDKLRRELTLHLEGSYQPFPTDRDFKTRYSTSCKSPIEEETEHDDPDELG